MALTERWLIRERDCDSDGWHQSSIDASSMAALDRESPAGAREFRAYCAQFAKNLSDEMSDEELEEVRCFVRQAAATGKDVWCSH